LVKTIPTIVKSFTESINSLKDKSVTTVSRTENDLSFKVVIIGSILLVVLLAIMPVIPGEGILQKLLIGILIIVFGFLFVTVASRIVGLVGSSNSPISGMTIATIMGTCLIFTAVGWTGQFYEPLALVVGGMICIAAANAGATSQDLKTGYIVGATPRYQQLALFIGAIVSSIAIGYVVILLDTPTPDMRAMGIEHAIGSERYPGPQATLMATLVKGIQSQNLDWQFVMVGVFIAVMIELCGIKALAFAIGLYLPLATTLPIFIGGAIKGLVDWRAERKNELKADDDLGKGSLFATGLIAGGALAGVIVALLTARDSIYEGMKKLSSEPWLEDFLGAGGYQIMGLLFFLTMTFMLHRIAIKKSE
jgi:putative OPT family oligopeptide transporter